MKVDLRTKVSTLQKDFEKEFGTKIRIYKGQHFADDVPLHEIAKEDKGGEIEFAGNTKVKTVENLFMEKFGIKIQVENQDGKLADNEATLASLRK